MQTIGNLGVFVVLGIMAWDFLLSSTMYVQKFSSRVHIWHIGSLVFALAIAIALYFFDRDRLPAIPLILFGSFFLFQAVVQYKIPFRFCD